MTYAETIAYLYQRLPVFHRIGKAAYKADLTNTLKICALLGHPERRFKSVHVAGTNGKGSTAHLLAAVLHAAGYRTGLYTSPHLKSFTERIRINGQPIPEAEVVRFVARQRAAIEEIAPSFFELTVGLAFEYFAREQVDIAVIEVGLGGRLDSTNVITPELSVITNISWDHADILGDTLPKIAAEKAGIIKPGVPVVVSERQPEVEAVFRQKAGAEQAEIYFASDDTVMHDLGVASSGLRQAEVMDLAGGGLVTRQVALPLLGDYQLKNVAGVWRAVAVLRKAGWTIGTGHVLAGIRHVVRLTGLKGRWQVLSRSPLTLCDTGHNEAGLREVAAQLARLGAVRLHLVIGMVNDKDLSRMLPLLPAGADYYFCQANIPRALPAPELAVQAAAHGLHGTVVPDVNAALAAARRAAGPHGVVFVGGSTFVVAELDEL